MDKKYWTKINTGWYEGQNGEVVQRWYRAHGSPGDKSGWYYWDEVDDKEDYLGPFKTMKEAIKEIKCLHG